MGLSQLEVQRPCSGIAHQGRGEAVQCDQRQHHITPAVLHQKCGHVEHDQDHRQPHEAEQGHALIFQQEQQPAEGGPRKGDDQRVRHVGGGGAGQRHMPVQRLCQQGIQYAVDAEKQHGGEKSGNGDGALPPVVLIDKQTHGQLLV